MAKELEVLETNRKKLKAKRKLIENDTGNTVDQNSAQTTLPACISNKKEWNSDVQGVKLRQRLLSNISTGLY